MTEKRAKRHACAVLVLTSALAIAACSSPDRAGGNASSDTVVLRMAQPNESPPEQLQIWVDEVERASNGSLKIKFEDAWRLGELEYEVGTIADVRAAKVDMAWVGARAFDKAGVSSFQALLAPTLINNEDLQQKVFESGIPKEMMADLSAVDLTGLGVLPGGMRRVLGVDKPFNAPADFVGATMGVQDSAVAELTFGAVGATTQNLPTGADLDGVDGYEAQISLIWGNHYAGVAKYINGNLNLWPRPLVMFIGPAVFDKLTEVQQTALFSAADTVMPTAMQIARAEDTGSIPDLCQAGMTLNTTSDTDLSSFTQAWEPVYDKLRENDSTSKWIDRISEFKESANKPADSATCTGIDVQPATSEVGSTTPGVLGDGTYRTVITPADFARGCKPGDPGAQHMSAMVDEEQTLYFEVTGDHIFQYQIATDGTREFGWEGTYATFRDSFELTENTGLVVVTKFTLENGVLTLSDMQTEYCDHKTIWTSEPWTKLPTP